MSYRATNATSTYATENNMLSKSERFHTPLGVLKIRLPYCSCYQLYICSKTMPTIVFKLIFIYRSEFRIDSYGRTRQWPEQYIAKEADEPSATKRWSLNPSLLWNSSESYTKPSLRSHMVHRKSSYHHYSDMHSLVHLKLSEWVFQWRSYH